MSTRLRTALRDLASDLTQVAPTAVWRRLAPKSCVGVCYHMVVDARPAHLKHYPVLDTGAFEADLDHLEGAYGFIDYPELAARRGAPDAPRDNRVILTFDDGFAECATVIAPILKRRGTGGVFFVITDLIDNRVLFRESLAALCVDRILSAPAPADAALATGAALSLGPAGSPSPSQALFGRQGWSALELAEVEDADPRLLPLLDWLLTRASDEPEALKGVAARLGVQPDDYLAARAPYLTREQIIRLHTDGFTIGAHGCSHRQLSDLTRDEAEREIVQSCRIIQEITGQARVPFAFPYFGGWLDRAWLADLRARHADIGLLFDTGGLREDAPFVVQRVFGERFTRDLTIERILRRAWGKPAAWSRRLS